MRRYPNTLQTYSNRQIPFPHITTRLWTGSSSCTSSAATLISIAGISLNTLPGTTGTTVLTSFRTAHHPFWQVKGGKCRSVSKALFPERSTECGSREGCETENRWTTQDMNGKDSWLAELRAALLKAGQWEVSTSRDLSLRWEHKADFASSGHVCCAEGTGVCRKWGECP
jgi:hypothetical protein